MRSEATDMALAAELRAARARIAELEQALAQTTRPPAGAPPPDLAPSMESNLVSFFNTIDHLLFVADLQGTILFTNRAVTDRLGYSAEELLGESVLKVHPPEQRAEAARIIDAMLKGDVEACPLPLLTKDGRQLPVETRAVKGSWSGRQAFFGVTKDLSALQASEAKFNKAFHASPAPMALTDSVTGQYVEVNEAFLARLGFARKEVVGKTATELHLFVDQEQRQRLLMRMRDQGYLRDEDVLVRTRRGEHRQGNFSAEFVHVQDGTFILTVMEDVTEKRQNAEALRQREEQYRTLVDALEISLCRWQPDTTLTYTNERYRRIFDVRGSGVGQQWLDFLPAAVREETASFYRQLAEHPNTVSYSHDVTVEDGTDRHFHWIDTPVFDAGGQLVEFQSVGIDITERIRAEDDLRRSRQMLADAQAIAQLESWTVDLQSGTVELGPTQVPIRSGRGGPVSAEAIMAMIHPGDEQALRKAWNEITAENPLDIECRILVDGELRWLHIKARLAGEEAGRPLSVLGVTQDITDRKQTEELVHAQRDLARVAATSQQAADAWRCCTSIALKVSGTDSGGLYLLDEDGRAFTLVHHHGLDESFVHAVEHYTIDTPNAQTILAGQIQYFAAADLAGLPLYQAEALRAVAIVPVIHQERVLGCINVASHTLAALPAYSRRALEAIAVEIGNTIAYLRAETALRNSEEKYRSLVDSQDSAIVTVDSDGVIYFMNRIGAAPFAGIHETIVGKKLGDLFPPEVAAWQMTRVRQVIATAEGIEAEYQTRLPGRPSWRRVSIQPIRNAAGQVTLAMVNSLDITERRQAEEALHESQARAQAMLSAIPDMMFRLNREGTFLDYKAEQNALFHQGGRSLVGLRNRDISPAAFAELIEQQIQATLESKVLRTFEYQLDIPGRGVRTYEARMAPSGEDEVLAVVRDITARKQVEQELQELNRTLEERVRQRSAEVQDLYENAPVGYHSVDSHGNLAMVNQTELDWLGYTRGEVLGRPVTNLLAPAAREIFYTNFPLLKQQGWIKDVQVDFARKDGSILPVVVSSTAVYDAEGNYVTSRSTVVDDTERKAADEAQRRANQALEGALRMKDEFLANMSHELRTPLNSVLALSEILLEQIYGPLNERQQRALRNVEASGRHLLALINDLLDLSKIEAGKLELALEQVPVDEACQASLTFVKEIANRKRLQISYRNEELRARVLADPRRLTQMLVNLLSNAVKFTPEGGQIQLSVKVRPEHGQIDFAVQDSGPGIAADDLPRLFQPFTQLDSALARQFEGTGLGLALVKRLAAQHGGAVQVTSTGVSGQGSCFTVTLPYTYQFPVEAPAGAGATPVPVAVPVSPETAGPQVLLVDDNEVGVEALSSYLEFLGFRTTIARTGQEALDLAHAEPPDIVLMDIQLPMMDGLEATRRLRSNPRFVTLPIIALTALAMPDDRARCLAAGATEYMSKPIRPRELVALMNRLLRA